MSFKVSLSAHVRISFSKCILAEEEVVRRVYLLLDELGARVDRVGELLISCFVYGKQHVIEDEVALERLRLGDEVQTLVFLVFQAELVDQLVLEVDKFLTDEFTVLVDDL